MKSIQFIIRYLPVTTPLVPPVTTAIKTHILGKNQIIPETLYWIYASQADQINIYNVNTLERRT